MIRLVFLRGNARPALERSAVATAQMLERRILLSANVLANHNDPGSTGEDLSETVLTPTTVGSTNSANSISTNFGRLFDTTLDGQVFAQPLAVANVNITRGSSLGIHNVLYVATMHDSLYAVDANTGAILWQDNFTQIANPRVTTIGSPVPTAGVTTIPGGVIGPNGTAENALVNSSDIGPELGILATPTIDPNTGIIYLVAVTQELRSGSTPTSTVSGADWHFVQRLWAVNDSSGAVAVTPSNIAAEPTSGGLVFADTILDPTSSGSNPSFSSYTGYKYVAGPYVKGTGDNGTNDSAPLDGWVTSSGDAGTPWRAASETPMAAGYIVFNSVLQMNRVATTLVNGEIYLGFASHGDDGPYYGWLLGYNASTLVNNVAWVSVPTYEPFSVVSGDDGSKDAQAGFWNAGATFTTDGTYLYMTTGNGAFNPDTSNFSSTFTSTDDGHTVELPLDDDYGDAVLKLQLDLNANQNNINISSGVINNPNGAYTPDSGYDTDGYGLKVVDFFTPSNVFEMNKNDEDLGSGGVLLIPTTGPGSATAPDGDPMLATAGKEGRLYLLDADNLGGYDTSYDVSNSANTGNTDPAPYDNVLGEFYYYQYLNPGTAANNQTYKGYDIPSYFDGEIYWGLGGGSTGSTYAPELGFSVSSLLFPTSVAKANRTSTYATPNFTTSNLFGGRGTTATISANGTSNAVIWNTVVTQSSTDSLMAYNTAGTTLFNSNWEISGQTSNTSDTLENGNSTATGIKFGVPTVFNGMVYVGTGGGSGSGGHIQGTITGYGLLSTQLTSTTFGAPTSLAAAAVTSTDIHLTWTGHSTLETEMEVDRSTDGVSWTTLAYLANGSTSYDDTVSAGSNYFYRVRAISGSSTTAFSETVISDGGASGDTYYLRINPSLNTQAQMFVNTPTSGTPTYTFTPSALASVVVDGDGGNDSLTVDYSSGSPVPSGGINFDGGTATNSLTVIADNSGDSFTLGVNTVIFGSNTINYANDQSLTITGGSGNDTVTQTAQPAASSVVFNGGTGSDTLNVNSGTYTFNSDPQGATLALSVFDNANVTFTAAASGSGVNLRSLTVLSIAPSATASLQTSSATADRLLLLLGSLSIGASHSTLDIGDNDLILHNGSVATLTSLLQKGYNSAAGFWNGSDGILSSAAASVASKNTAIGYELNNNGLGGLFFSTFDGQRVSTSDVLVKYTFAGDANLDGIVNASDFTLIDNGFNNALTGWRNGDFNYDGVVNGDDYTIIDNAFNSQTPTLPASVPQSVAATAASPVDVIAVRPAVEASAWYNCASPDIRRRGPHSIWLDLPF